MFGTTLVPANSRRARKPAELLLVPMIDIFTVLVTFLLMTAVFSRITIVQLDLPSASDGKVTEPTFRLEVIVRPEGLELTNGRESIAALPLVNGDYDLTTLSAMALALKKEHPTVDTASVLMAPEVEYDNLIQVMDAIRSADARTAAAAGLYASTVGADGQQTTIASGRVPLFTAVALGDAP